jgi:hypothetical protein
MIEEHMSKWSIIIYVLIASFLVISLWGYGTADKEWAQCKESLIAQYLGSDCTPIGGIGIQQRGHNPVSPVAVPGSNI